MTQPTCAICGKPLADGATACSNCTAEARHHLTFIGDFIGDAREIAYGLGSGPAGITAGMPGSRVPLDLHAAAKLDAVAHELGMLCRMVAEERRRAIWVWTEGPIREAVAWLPGHLEWLRHHRAAAEHLAIIAACRRAVASVVFGPTEKRYLGPCGADVVRAEMVGDQWESQVVACDGDVYGRPGAEQGTCRACGARVDQGERRAWLDDEVRQYAYTAKEIADAYGINIKTIRSWRDRGRLVEHGAGYFNLGEVLDLAAKEAARREETRAKRERREEAREERERARDEVGYMAVHQRLRRERGPASAQDCRHCEGKASDWAYDHGDPDHKMAKNGPYSVDLNHYIPLCRRCHKTLDHAQRASA